MSEQAYERAKDKVTRERKREAEKRRKDREDRLLRDEEDMNTTKPGC